jgi:hypothetical protein
MDRWDMKNNFFAILLSLFTTSSGVTGTIFGQLSSEAIIKGKADITIICPEKEYHVGIIDVGKSYRIQVNETGACKIQVKFKNDLQVIGVTSYDTPCRVDLFLKQRLDGSYILKRK